MKIQDGAAVEADVCTRLYQELDGGLVLEDHLPVGRRFAFSGFAKFDQTFSVE